MVKEKKQQYPSLAEFAKVTHIPLRDHIHNFYDHAMYPVASFHVS
jgi:hypothetical protein